MNDSVQPRPESDPAELRTERNAKNLTNRRPWNVTTYRQFAAFWFFALVALAVALRPLGMDKDYQNYAEYYNSIVAGQYVNVELGYKLLSWLNEVLGVGFLGVLYVYAFTAMYSKYVLIRRLSGVSAGQGVYFGIIYFLVLFPFWELTQIRNAAAIAVCCLAIIEARKSKACIYFCFAILLHNVSFIVLGFWLLRRYFNGSKYLILIVGVAAVSLFLEYMPYYQFYATDVYAEKFNPFSFKVLFITVTFFYVQFSKVEQARVFAYYSLGFLLLYFAMAKMSAAAVRVADVSLFFSILALSISRGCLAWFYKLAVLVALGSVFTWISYFSEARLINLSVIQFAGF